MNILKELKKENKKNKVLINFKIDENLIKEFKKKCDKHNLKYSRVVSFLIQEFLNSK